MNSFRSSIASWTSARYHPLRRRGLGETLSLLHGNPAWCFLYRKIIAALKRDFRCVALDYPRYGMSGAPAGYGFTPGEHSLVFGRSANKPGVPDNNTRSTISSFVCLSRAYIVLYSS